MPSGQTELSQEPPVEAFTKYTEEGTRDPRDNNSTPQATDVIKTSSPLPVDEQVVISSNQPSIARCHTPVEKEATVN